MMTDPQSELLARLPQRAALSLTPTALPDRTHRPARDAARDARGTGNVLASLEGSDLLGVPLDRRGAWYQYHHLFRELVGAESGQPQPKPAQQQAQQLHARAAAWCEPTDCWSWPSTMPRPPGTPIGSPGWSKASRFPPMPAGASTPPAAGSSGSRTKS